MTEDELDFCPVKDIVPISLNEHLHVANTKKSDVKFYHVDVNLTHSESRGNKKSRMKKSHQSSKLPQVVWEDVPCSESHGIRKEESIQVTKIPICKDIATERTVESTHQHLNEVSHPSNSKSVDSDTPRVSSKSTKDQKQHSHKPMFQLPLEEIGHMEIASGMNKINNENCDYFGQELKDKNVKDSSIKIFSSTAKSKEKNLRPKAEEVLFTRIHAGRLQSPNKDYIREWRKAEDKALKIHGPKPSKLSPQNTPIGSKGTLSPQITPIGSKRTFSPKNTPIGSKRTFCGEQVDANKQDYKSAQEEPGSTKRLKSSKEQSTTDCIGSDEKVQKGTRVRHYDPESARKFIAAQKTKRKEQRVNEAKKKQEEKAKVETRLKELATHYTDKAVEKSPINKEAATSKHKVMAPLDVQVHSSKKEHKISASYSTFNYDGFDVGPLGRGSERLPSEERRSKDNCVIKESGSKTHHNSAKKKSYQKENRDAKKKSEYRNNSDSDAISDILSRTLQECEKQMNESSISDGSEHTPSEKASSNTMKQIPKDRQERINSLDKMAKRIAETIDREEQYLHRNIREWQNTKSSRSHSNSLFTKNEIENKSVKDLMRKMASLLPKSDTETSVNNTNDNKGDQNKRHTRQINLTASKQNAQSVHDVQTSYGFTSSPVNAQKSSHDTQPHFRFETPKSSLKSKPDYAVSDYTYDLNLTSLKPLSTSLADTRLPVGFAMTTPTLTRPNFLFDMGEERRSQQRNQDIKVKRKYSHREIKAAIIIQSCFRGYKVRKVTSYLFQCRNQESEYNYLKSKNIASSISSLVVPKRIDIRSYNIGERDKDEVDWFKLEEHLRKTTQIKVPKINDGIEEDSTLPKHIQPFYELAKTGDVEHFINSYSKPAVEKEISNSPKQSFSTHISGTVRSADMRGLAPDHESLIEEIGLQTSNSDMRLEEETRDTKPKFGSPEEIDLKVFTQQKQQISIHSNDISGIKPSLKSDSRLESASISHSRGYEQFYSVQGYSEDTQSSTIDYNKDNLDSQFEGSLIQHPISEKNTRDYLASKSSFPPNQTQRKQIPPEQYNMSPANMSSRINAELLYQDTLSSALSHLEELQNLRTISHIEERSSGYLDAFRSTQTRNQEMSRSLCDLKEEAQSLRNERKSKEVLQISLERMEHEAQIRMNKFEQDIRMKAEQILCSNDRVRAQQCSLQHDGKIQLIRDSISSVSSKVPPSFSSECIISSTKISDSIEYSPDFLDSSNSHSLYASDQNKSILSSESDIPTEISLSKNVNSHPTLKSVVDTSIIGSVIEEDVNETQISDSSEKNRSISEKIDYGDKSPSTHSGSNIQEEISGSFASPSSLSHNIPKNITAKSIGQSTKNSGKMSTTMTKSDEISEDLPSYSTKQLTNVSIHSTTSEIITSFSSQVTLSNMQSNTNSQIANKSTHSNMGEHSSRIAHSVKRVDTSGTYSESFEPDSQSSDNSESSFLQSKIQKTIIEIQSHTLQNSSNFDLLQKQSADLVSTASRNQSEYITEHQKRNKQGALQVTLKYLESLQKEEDVRFNHQKAYFKMQEQLLGEEAKAKLTSLTAEGGVNVRKKQRAILMQLREQKAHLRRLIETQNLAAQQKHLMFSQLHQLLSSTSNIGNLTGNRLLPSRGQSPVTSKVLDMSLSSSDGLESFSCKISPLSSLKTSGKSRLQILAGNDESENVDGNLDWEENKENRILGKLSDKEKDLTARKGNKSDHTNKIKGKLITAKYNDVISDNSIPEDVKSDSEVNYSSTICTSLEEIGNSSFVSHVYVPENTSSDSTYKEEVNHSLDSAQTPIQNSLSRDNSHPEPSSVNETTQPSESSGSQSVTTLKKSTNSLDATWTNDQQKQEKRMSMKAPGVPFTLKFPLSPRSHLQRHRRSSESDDSFTLSQNETASDMSDGEGKLIALKEELNLRKCEAERLQKEKRRIRRERHSSQEEALRKQIEAYDNYIRKSKLEIEENAKELQRISVVKPLIKRPKVAGSKKLISLEHSSISDSDALDESSHLESTLLEASSVLDYSVVKAAEENSSISSSSTIKTDSSLKEDFSSTQSSQSNKIYSEGQVRAQESQSESFASETKNFSDSENTFSKSDNKGTTKIANVEWGESDHSESFESSTETILHSPKKYSFKEIEPVTGVLIESLASEEKEGTINDNEISSIIEKQDTGVDEKQDAGEDEKLDTAVDDYVIKESEESRKSSTVDQDSNVSESGISEVNKVEELDSVDLLPTKPELIDKRSEKLDIFVPSVNKLQDEETTSETITEEIVQDKSEKGTLSTDIHPKSYDETSHVTSTDTDSTTSCNKKANRVADSILETLLKDSVSCIKNIIHDKEKDVAQIIVHINESADKDLKSENTSDSRELTSKSSLIGESKTVKEGQRSFRNTLSRIDEHQEQNQTSSAESGIIDVTPSTTELECDNLEKDLGNSIRINSPADSKLESKAGVDAEELASKLLNVHQEQNSLSEFDDVPSVDETFVVSSFEGEWLEGEFWRNGEIGDSFSSQKDLKEEEELLNAEIARLEELQRLKEQYPDLVIREVPNKPPPPYTPPKPPQNEVKTTSTQPPASPPPRKTSSDAFPQPQTSTNTISGSHRLSKADLRRISTDIAKIVPTDADEMKRHVESFVDRLYVAWQKGCPPSTVPDALDVSQSNISPERDSGRTPMDSDSHKPTTGNPLKEENPDGSQTIFQRLLFHVTRELVSEVYALSKAPPPPPYVLTPFRVRSLPWQVVQRFSKETLTHYVIGQVRVLMGHDPPAQRESTMLKWSRKKREKVDQILVQELQAEECNWTEYGEEEVHVKVQLSQEIFADLVDDCIIVFQQIFNKKLKQSRGVL